MTAGRLAQAVVVLLILAAVVFLLLPWETLWPGWLPHARFQGTVDGEPVTLSLDTTSSTAEQVPVRIQFEMEEGVLRVAYPEMTGLNYLVGGERGDYTQKYQRDKKLLLDPMGGRGRYDVTVGWPDHPLTPGRRRLTAFAMLGGLVFGLLWPKLSTSQTRPREWLDEMATWTPPGVQGRHWVAVWGVALVSGIVLYGMVHELGHTIVPGLHGITPSRVVWTMFSGEEPHVEWAERMTGGVRAGSAAGGTLFPSVVALALLAVWSWRRRRLSVWTSILLPVPAVCFLFAHVSGPIDAVRYMSGDHPAHMATLGEYLGYGRVGTALLCAAPLGLTLAVCGWLLREMRRRRVGD